MNNLQGFIGEVIDHEGDQWKSGRVKLRIYGRHDNEQDIKDEDLPWAMPLQDVTSAATNRIGRAPVGMVKGSRVFGVYLDEEQQYPLILGTFSRAGKLKDENDNTGGKDDIDNKYSDTPLAAIGKKKSNTRAKKTIEKRDDKLDNSKYNKKEYTKEDEAEDPLDKSRSKYADKTNELKTIGSIGKDDDSSVLSKILKVDNGNQAGALPMAPQMFQQILQSSNMTGAGGMGGLTGGALGGAFGGMAGNFGIGNVLGQLGGALGIDISMLSGMTGMLGGMGGGGGGGGSGGSPAGGGAGSYVPTNYTGPVPTTPNDISVTAAELLNQLGGFKSPTGEIAGMSVEDREALYLALIDLMNSVGADLNTNSYISISQAQKVTIDRYKDHVTLATVSETPLTEVYSITLPGEYVESIENIPVGYIQVFYFTEVDPYPGYMEWLGPEGQRLFCDRPSDRPYAATPEEDAMNAAILTIIEELLELIRDGRLTISKTIELTQAARQAATAQGMENTHGNGMSNMGNMMGMIQQILGMLGQLIQQAQQNHLPESVLEKGSMQKTLENYSKKGTDLRRKKKMAKQAVEQKNQGNMLGNQGMLNFGNMGGMGGSGGGGGNGGGGNYGNYAGITPNNTITTTITKTGNNVQISTKPIANTSNVVSFGYYSIYTS